MKQLGAMVLAVGMAWAVGLSGGCYFERQGHADRMETTARPEAPGIAWPDVPRRALDEVVWGSPDMTPLGPAPAGAFLAALGGPVDGSAWRRDLEADQLALLRTRVGLVRVKVTRDGRPFDAPMDFVALFRGFAANGWVQSGLTFGTPGEAMSAALALEGRGLELGVWCGPFVVASERAPGDRGIAVRIPPSAPAEPKGVIVHLWALMSNPYEKEVMAEMVRRGWVVVDIDTRTSVPPAVTEDEIARAVTLQRRIRTLSAALPKWDGKRPLDEVFEERRRRPEAAEVDRLERELSDAREPATVVGSPAEAVEAGRRIAGQVDETLAANAYAAEAALAAVHAVYPRTGTLPTVVMGFSAGGLSAPTVAARLASRGHGSRGKVAAVVVVGGAANLLETAVKSELTDGGLRVQGPGGREVPGDLLQVMSAAYLGASRLDPYHTAPTLQGIPVLQVHAVWDTWVPAANGELLTERLGYPDRLVMPGGHGMLFYFLPKRKAWIADWVEAHAGKSGPSGG